MAETLRNKRSAADPDGTSGLRPSARIAAGMNGENGSMYARDAWWNALSPQLRDRIDGLLCARRLIAAVVLLRREGGLQPTPGLYQAQDLLIERRAELDGRGLVEPEPTPATTAQLIEKAAAITAPVVAVEALWDGDTQGWCVDLVAIVRRPGRHHDRFDEVPLTVLRQGGDIRLFNGHVPPWPEARQATEQGQAVAQHVGVPFHFTSPEAPDVELQRWWDAQPT
ncbi:hypothetical protein GCM10010169_35190 [Micromonospora fulviviridis]|uniref:hypothetical protein n=1 Tax=Micromonospora fulviviridis TaxID=47860 RepID=UPI00166A9B13|nr:hypothetical protein [Micromonospora fulviviridis]GGR87902.1 hypothetical protein GCM10010169_35190 [Micromonospora fulviviridis]